jgi:hypothetical protein
MSEAEPYVRFLFRRWAKLRVILTLEQEGLLVRISSYIYEHHGEPVPSNESQAAKALGVQRLQYRKVLKQLIALGELEVVDGAGVVSPRAVAEWSRMLSIKRDASANGKKGQLARREAQQNPPSIPPSNPGSIPPGNYPSYPPSNRPGMDVSDVEIELKNESHPEAIRLRKEEDKKNTDSEFSPAHSEAIASRSSGSGSFFSLDEQGAGLIRNSSAFKWLDPKTGEPRRLTFQFIAGLAPQEPRDLMLDFAESELLAAIDAGREGGLHGILRNAIDKGRLASFKLRRSRSYKVPLEELEPEGGLPITAGSWD